MQLSMTATLTPDDVKTAVARFVSAEINQLVKADDVSVDENGIYSVNTGAAAEPVKTKTARKATKLKAVETTPEPETSESDNPETSAESSEETETPDTSESEETSSSESDGTEAVTETESAQEQPAPRKVAAGSIFGKR